MDESKHIATQRGASAFGFDNDRFVRNTHLIIYEMSELRKRKVYSEIVYYY